MRKSKRKKRRKRRRRMNNIRLQQEQSKMLADSAEGARREVPQLMQV